MRFQSGIWLVVVAAMCLPLSSAMADDRDSGPYFGVRGGIGMLNDATISADARGGIPALEGVTDFDPGLAVSSGIGYAFVNGLRIEGEVGYRKFNQTALDIEQPGGFVATEFPNFPLLPPEVQSQVVEGFRGEHELDGDNVGISLMVNTWYDIDLGWAVTPYIGGGVGMFFISVKEPSSTGIDLVDDHDTVFAYQLGGGIGYDVAMLKDRPVTVSLDYRYFDPSDPRFEGNLTGITFDAPRSGHYIGVGIRLGF